MSKVLYAYVAVRTDIPIADQIVQVGHACLEAGRRFGGPDSHVCNMVLMQIKSRGHLLKLAERAILGGVDLEIFYEPDDDMRETAFCTAPVGPEYRKIFKGQKLWEHLPDSTEKTL